MGNILIIISFETHEKELKIILKQPRQKLSVVWYNWWNQNTSKHGDLLRLPVINYTVILGLSIFLREDFL